jgi:transcriptional regulator GlxA family with amidase domain
MFTPQPEPRSGRADAENCRPNDPRSPEPPTQNQPDGGAPADWRVQKVIALFGRDLSRHWTLGELAALACVTPSYLERLFKAATGTGPLQYLKALRLKRALAELTTSEKPVRQIAAEVGYRPQGRHFFRDFRACYGLSPQECRRQCQGWEEEIEEAK